MTHAFVVGANELAKYSHQKYVYYATNISCVDHNAKIHVSMLKGEAMIIADPWEAQQSCGSNAESIKCKTCMLQ